LAASIDPLGQGPVSRVKHQPQLAQFPRELFRELGMRIDHRLQVDWLALGPSLDTVLDNDAEAGSRFRLLRTAEKRTVVRHAIALSKEGGVPERAMRAIIEMVRTRCKPLPDEFVRNEK
jgi:hypothetical protein